ncbi:MAG TPA: hypothetical protein PLW88_06665 [Syntrophorhabdaceae bacterium]|nr:hypothetical protein [Syntrophorhabdaceae bacterium]
MPRGDGTGPIGQGRGQGGRCSGRAQNANKGRMGGRGLGPAGTCVCPSCGTTAPHERGIPCYKMKCPNCGTTMTRG